MAGRVAFSQLLLFPTPARLDYFRQGLATRMDGHGDPDDAEHRAIMWEAE